MLFHRDREIDAALHRGVIRDDHAQPVADSTDAGDDAATGDLVVMKPVRSEASDFEKGRERIDQRLYPLARQHLAASHVTRSRLFSAAELNPVEGLPQLSEAQSHRGEISLVIR